MGGSTINEEEALAVVYDALKRGTNSREAISSLDLESSSESLIALWKKETITARAPDQYSAFLPFHYVIPDQELKLVEAVSTMMSTAAGVQFLLPALGFDPGKGLMQAVVGAIVVLLKLYQNLHMSVRLSDTDYAIVALLAEAGNSGLSAQELQNMVKHNFPGITTDDISSHLLNLTTCVNANGTKTALTWKDNSERWYVNGV